MNTKLLMASTSLWLGALGLLTLFAPHEVLVALGAVPADPLPVIVQLLGAVYWAFAITNWMAKESAIGGIYARPISLGNFVHFTIGALTLAKYQLAQAVNWPLAVALGGYSLGAFMFGWLAFVASGTVNKH